MTCVVQGRDATSQVNVPSNPDKVYMEHGWQGFGHWLGSGNAQKKLFLPFDEALAVAQSLGSANMRE